MATRTLPEKPKTAKSVQKDEPKFICTPEQKFAALEFLKRTIEVQEIIGPYTSGMGQPDILATINDEYHAAVEFMLDQQGLKSSIEHGPVTITLQDGGPGFILHARDIARNGPMGDQAKSKDFLFATRGLNAGAYEVGRLGKSRYKITVYFNTDWSEGDIGKYLQIIELNESGFVPYLRCPYCTQDFPELYVSYWATYFGCVRCHTVLNAKEAAIYQRTVKIEGKAVSR